MKRSHLYGFLASILAASFCILPLHAQPDPASPWPMFHGDVRHTGQSDSLSSQDGKLLWSYATGADVYSSACAGADGTIYFGSDKEDKNIYAISFGGERLWSYTTGDAIQGTCALSSSGNIYIGSHDGRFYALTTAGTLVWSYETGDVNDAPPVEGDDGKIYFGSNNDRFYALRSAGDLGWSYATDGDIWGGAAIGAGGDVIVGSLDKHLYVLNSTGTLKWSYNLSESLKAGVAIDADGNIYGGTSSITTYFYSITSDGSLRWTQYATDFYSTPAISDSGTIYAGSDNNNLYAYNSDSTLSWSYSTGNQVHNGTAAIGSDGMVYASSKDNYCYAFTPSGSVRWSYSIGSSECAPSIGAYGTLYAGSNDNVMYAFEGLPTPTPTSTPIPNYINLSAGPAVVSPGTSVTLNYVCDFTMYDYRGKPVNIYIAAIQSPRISDEPSSVADALAGGKVYLFGPRMKSVYRYRGSLGKPTWSGAAFPPVPTSGSVKVTVPASPVFAGDWVFATAFIRRDTRAFVRTDGLPVENSNLFTIP